jgi:hypothetical protein
MIENITSSNQLLYHYTRADTALEHILKGRTLQLGSYIGTNDPKETKIWEFDLGTNENRDLGRYNMAELSEWLSSRLKGKAKVACFSMDGEDLTGDHTQDIFKRGFCKPRMWAQYADNHSGVCLVFDLEKLSKRIVSEFSAENLFFYGPVKYTNRQIVRNLYDPDDQQYTINVDYLEKVGREAYVEAHLRTHYQRLFFEKMEDWKDESEWRYVVFSQTEGNLYIDFEGSLVGIMYGANTTEENVQSIMELTESWGLRHMGLKWKNCSPWYDYGNPRYSPVIKSSPLGKHI